MIVNLYTDGGATTLSDRHLCGWGFHGYICIPEVNKIGAGLSKHIPTVNGYTPKTEVDKASNVTILKYFDGYGYAPDTHTTNNQAELRGAVDGLSFLYGHANETPDEVKRINLFTDSRYVVDGFNKHLKTWIKAGWKTSNGQPVKNPSLWEDLIRVTDELKAKGIEVSFNWTKGHANHPGNDKADLLANIAQSEHRKTGVQKWSDWSEPKGYWKADATAHRLLCHPYWYFNDHLHTEHDEHGYWYYCGNHGSKDDDGHLGKRVNNASYSVVCLNEKEEALEAVVNKHVEVNRSRRRPFNIVIGRMAAVLSGKNSKLIRDYGESAFKLVYRGNGIVGVNKAEFSSVQNPPRLAERAVMALDSLSNQLRRLIANQPLEDEKYTDITRVIYEDGKKAPQIKKSINAANPSVDVELDAVVEGVLVKRKIALVVGVDLPTRNALAAVAGDETKVFVVTWPEPVKAFRVATVVLCKDGFGIWSNHYSNIRL